MCENHKISALKLFVNKREKTGHYMYYIKLQGTKLSQLVTL